MSFHHARDRPKAMLTMLPAQGFVFVRKGILLHSPGHRHRNGHSHRCHCAVGAFVCCPRQHSASHGPCLPLVLQIMSVVSSVCLMSNAAVTCSICSLWLSHCRAFSSQPAIGQACIRQIQTLDATGHFGHELQDQRQTWVMRAGDESEGGSSQCDESEGGSAISGITGTTGPVRSARRIGRSRKPERKHRHRMAAMSDSDSNDADSNTTVMLAVLRVDSHKGKGARTRTIWDVRT